MINYRLIYRILIVSMAIFLVKCSEPPLSPDLMDKSPFSGIPCAAPCWHGLMIGESSESEVMETLPKLTFIDQHTIYVHRMSMPGLDFSTYAPGAEITANCVRPGKQCLTVDVVDDILTRIDVVLNYEIRLDEAIRYLGNPDYVGYQNLGAEQIICEVYLVWSSRQLVLASGKFFGHDAGENNCGVVRDTGKTVPSLLISEARYMSIAEIDFFSHPGEGVFKFSGTIPEK